MASIADLFFTFRGDDGQLRLDAAKAGEVAGQTLGQRMSSGMKAGMKAGLVGLGAAGGALFGVAAKGGAALTETVAKYRAETGATAQEAQAAQASIGKLYRNNVEGFETLGALLASVKTNLGLTGAEGEAAADRLTKYAKVTGQDGVAAVGAFDDILDTWGLSVERGTGLLDQLIASHQLYGGSVAENQKTLAALAPALRAANFEVDDGIAILNLFGAKGLDAEVASAAFAKALTKVKSPKELQRLIDDISATEDPFKRAEKAADLFGARAGAKLANALGGVDLDDFTVSVDDAAGALQEASDAVDASPYNRLQLALHKLAGPLAEVGTKFGPLVLGFSQLGGGKLIAGVTGSLGALGGKVLPGLVASLAGLLPALGGTLAALGSGIGGLIAAAIPVGMALLPVLLIGALVAAVAFLVANPEIVGQIAEVASSLISGLVDVLAGLAGALLDLFQRAFDVVLNAAPGFVGTVARFILTLPFRILDLQVKLLEFFAGIFTSILGKLPWFIGEVVRLLFTIPGKLVSLGGQIVRAIIEGMASLPGKLADVVAAAFRNLRIDIGPFHIRSSGVKIDLPKIELPAFAVGTPFVPRNMLALVHAGEMIIPAATSDAIRAGRAVLATTPAAGATQTARTLTVNVYNPAPEPASTSTKRELQKLAAFGVLG